MAAGLAWDRLACDREMEGTDRFREVAGAEERANATRAFIALAGAVTTELSRGRWVGVGSGREGDEVESGWSVRVTVLKTLGSVLV